MTVADFTQTLAVIYESPAGQTTPGVLSYGPHAQTIHDFAKYYIEGGTPDPGDWQNTHFYTGQKIYWPGRADMTGYWLWIGTDIHHPIGVTDLGATSWPAEQEITWTPPAGLAPDTYRLYACKGKNNIATDNGSSTVRVILDGPPPTPIITEVKLGSTTVWPTRVAPDASTLPPATPGPDDATVYVTWDDQTTRDVKLEISYIDDSLVRRSRTSSQITTSPSRRNYGGPMFALYTDQKVRVVGATHTTEWFPIHGGEVLHIHMTWDDFTSNGHFIASAEVIAPAAPAPPATQRVFWIPEGYVPAGQIPVLSIDKRDNVDSMILTLVDASIISFTYPGLNNPGDVAPYANYLNVRMIHDATAGGWRTPTPIPGITTAAQKSLDTGIIGVFINAQMVHMFTGDWDAIANAITNVTPLTHRTT